MVSKVSINSEDSIIPTAASNGGITFEIKTASKEISLNEQEDLIQQTLNNIQKNNTGSRRRSTGSALTPPPPVI